MTTYLDEVRMEQCDAARERLAEQRRLRAAGAPRPLIHYQFPQGNGYITACRRAPWYADISYRRDGATCIRCLQVMAAGRAD